ncbi:MAG: DUF3084 domain-containing protein [Armatimonadetes bacterium]|nr:DUF3084 domain-containing protein [Armatimonadota bacterium]
MEPGSVWFILGMMVTGGFLAYFADSLGRKLGKKRLSLLGLRPRYTATILTVLAGVVIPLLAMAAMLIGSGSVREWLLRSGQVKQERDQLLRETQNLTTSNSKLKQDEASAKAKLQETRNLLASRSSQLKNLNSKLSLLTKQAVGLQRKFNAAERAVATQTRLASRLSREVQTGRAALGLIKNQLTSADKALGTAKLSLGSVQTSYSRLNAEYLSLNREFLALRGQVDDLTSDRDSLNTQLEDGRKKLTAAQTELQDQRRRLEENEGRLAELQRSLEGAKTSLYEPIIYGVGTEVGRKPVNENLTPGEARKAVEDFLSAIQTSAIQRGARNSDTVQIVQLPNGPQIITPFQDRLKEELIKVLTGNREPMVLMSVAAFNTFRTESVPIQTLLKSNPLIFRKGQVIEKLRIDGRQGFVEVLDQVTQLAQNTFQTAVIAGLIPRDDTATTDPRSLIAVVSSIRAEGRVVQVQVIAKEDTRAADDLNLEFKVVR